MIFVGLMLLLLVLLMGSIAGNLGALATHHLRFDPAGDRLPVGQTCQLVLGTGLATFIVVSYTPEGAAVLALVEAPDA